MKKFIIINFIKFERNDDFWSTHKLKWTLHNQLCMIITPQGLNWNFIKFMHKFKTYAY